MNMETLTRRMQQGDRIPLSTAAGVAFSLSVPAILETLVDTMMSYIDSSMVGQLGAAASAAIGVVASTTWLFGGLIGGFATGFSVQVAQYLGAKRERDARSVLRQGILFNLMAGCGLGLLALTISGALPVWMHADQAIRADASLYFRIWALAMPMRFGCQLYASVLRCSGDTRTPSLLNIGMCLLDVVFNYFFINPAHTAALGGLAIPVPGLGLGVAGAALGTAAANTVCAVAMLACVTVRSGPLQFKRGGSWRITRSCMHNLLVVGLPSAAERAALGTAQVVTTRIVAGLGTVAVAANSLSVTTEGLCYMPAYGVSSAVTAMVGQAFGAGRKDMAKRFAWICTLGAMLIMVAMGALMYGAAPWLIGLMTPDAEVIALGAQVLRIEAFAEPLFGASIVATGALRGAGDSRGPFVLNLVSMWGVRITASFLLAPYFGLAGVWAAMALELSVRGALFLARLFRGKWLERELLL